MSLHYPPRRAAAAVLVPLGLSALLAIAGCSIVNDPNRHREGGGMDASPGEDGGSGEDTGPGDAGGDPDAGRDAMAGEDAGTDAGPPDSGPPDAGPVDAGPEVAPGDYCNELAALGCQAYADCCDPTLQDPAFQTNCMTNLRAGCMSLLEDLLSNTAASGYDAHVAAAALEEARNLIATCDLGLADWVLARDGLYSPFLGSLPVDAQCVSPGAEPADDSYFANFICADGRTCIDQGAPGWACRPLGSNPCRNYLDCPSGQFCSGANVCEVQRGNGDFCNPLNPVGCASLNCTGINCVARTQEFVYCTGLEALGG